MTANITPQAPQVSLRYGCGDNYILSFQSDYPRMVLVADALAYLAAEYRAILEGSQRGREANVRLADDADFLERLAWSIKQTRIEV